MLKAAMRRDLGSLVIMLSAINRILREEPNIQLVGAVSSVVGVGRYN